MVETVALDFILNEDVTHVHSTLGLVPAYPSGSAVPELVLDGRKDLALVSIKVRWLGQSGRLVRLPRYLSLSSCRLLTLHPSRTHCFSAAGSVVTIGRLPRGTSLAVQQSSEELQQTLGVEAKCDKWIGVQVLETFCIPCFLSHQLTGRK
jgi:hypothetical protein